MTFTRRTFVRLSLGSAISMTAERLLAQGVSTHTAKPVPRQAPSGRPFDAHFVDVSAAAGLHAPTIYGGVETKKYILESTGCGCAFVDYDNDGWMDLFLLSGTRLEAAPAGATNRLYKNNRDGTFIDVTEAAGLGAAGWASGVCVGDYTNCHWKGIPVECGPRGMPTGRHSLYRNNGDGTFTDVTQKAGIAQATQGYGMTVVAADLDEDGWPDIYVACDSTPSLLFMNNHDGTFREEGVVRGVALSEDGQEQAGMGVGIGDYDLDGHLDLFKTHFADDANVLYRNDGKGNF